MKQVIKYIVYRLLYTAWLSRSFKAFGEGSVIEPHDYFVGNQYICIEKHVVIGKGDVISMKGKFFPRKSISVIIHL